MSAHHGMTDADRFHLNRFPDLVRAERARRGLTQRGAARELGLGTSTMCRIEKGGTMDVYTFLVIVQWLGLTLDWFTGTDKDRQDAYRRGWNDCAALVWATLSDVPNVANTEREGTSRC